MATESELRREAANERQQLTNAVDSLKGEIGEVAERGKQIGVAVGVATGAAMIARIVFRLRRR